MLWSNGHCGASTLAQSEAQFRTGFLDASKQKLRLSLGPDILKASSNFRPPPCTCSTLKGPNNSALSPAVDIRVSSQSQTQRDKQNFRNYVTKQREIPRYLATRLRIDHEIWLMDISVKVLSLDRVEFLSIYILTHYISKNCEKIFCSSWHILIQLMKKKLRYIYDSFLNAWRRAFRVAYSNFIINHPSSSQFLWKMLASIRLTGRTLTKQGLEKRKREKARK